MNILVTGAKGFVGRNLVAQLHNIQDGKALWYPVSGDITVYEYDTGSDPAELDAYCRNADFVFNLAGVNRPEDPAEFMRGNAGFASVLLGTLRKYGNTCPVMLSSSVQASLTGRYAGSEYGKSKLAGEKLFFDYSEETGAEVLVYRFPNVFGKWCRPNYNSAVATFCYNIANDLPVQVNDRSTELELVYIDDLVDEMIMALAGKEHRCEFDGAELVHEKDGKYCHVPVTFRATLGEITDMLYRFETQQTTLVIPEIPEGSFAQKLYSTYLSYLPERKAVFPLKMNTDGRGSFTEMFRSGNCGQVSINISGPGIVKGRHWHNTKSEIFIVVSGHGLIRQRKVGTEEVMETEVSGDRIMAVRTLPGYVHDIVNLSETENLVTVIWCSGLFDPDRPDTYSESVK